MKNKNKNKKSIVKHYNLQDPIKNYLMSNLYYNLNSAVFHVIIQYLFIYMYIRTQFRI